MAAELRVRRGWRVRHRAVRRVVEPDSEEQAPSEHQGRRIHGHAQMVAPDSTYCKPGGTLAARRDRSRHRHREPGETLRSKGRAPIEWESSSGSLPRHADSSDAVRGLPGHRGRPGARVARLRRRGRRRRSGRPRLLPDVRRPRVRPGAAAGASRRGVVGPDARLSTASHSSRTVGPVDPCRAASIALTSVSRTHWYARVGRRRRCGRQKMAARNASGDPSRAPRKRRSDALRASGGDRPSDARDAQTRRLRAATRRGRSEGCPRNARPYAATRQQAPRSHGRSGGRDASAKRSERG
jgi:hypothetical protein